MHAPSLRKECGRQDVARGVREQQDLLARAKRVDATFAVGRGFVTPALAVAPPIFAQRGKGPHVWDIAGRRFLDMLLGFGSVVLGHADPRVTEAVVAEVRRDVMTTLHKSVQIELAELLVSVSPGAEMVLFCKTGSDATSAAVRLARVVTGKEGVIRWGYHGWHDWCAERLGGVSDAAQRRVRKFQYNDRTSLDAEIARLDGNLACVIMLPYELELPEPGFLEHVRATAHRHGALFVLDEIRSGFRIALGGAQEYFGVDADLVTYSKAMANGFAISAVVGREEILRCAADVAVSSTFFRVTDAMAAAKATIGVIAKEDVPTRLWELGRRLMVGLDTAAAEVGLPARSIGLPPTPFHAFALGDEELNARARQTFSVVALEHGVIFHPDHHWFVAASMTEADIDYATEVARAGYEAVAREIS